MLHYDTPHLGLVNDCEANKNDSIHKRIARPQEQSISGRAYSFYPRDAMLARVIAIATCLSVRPSVGLSVCHAPVLCQNEKS